MSFKSGFVLSLCLCLWAPCLISIRECLTGEGAGWQLVFVFRLQYVCLIQSLIVCGVLFNGPRGDDKCSNCTFHSRQNDDAEWSAANTSTKARKTHTYKHTPSQSICRTTSTGHYWREKKRMRKSIGQWPPWNSCCCTVMHLFHMCTTPIMDREEVEARRRRMLEEERPEGLVTTMSQENVLCYEAVGHSLNLWNIQMHACWIAVKI